MTSSTLQISLSLREVNLLAEEANTQMNEAMHIREEAIAHGEKVLNLKPIAPSTIATQIIRQSLPGLEAKLTKAKKEKRKKGK